MHHVDEFSLCDNPMSRVRVRASEYFRRAQSRMVLSTPIIKVRRQKRNGFAPLSESSVTAEQEQLLINELQNLQTQLTDLLERTKANSEPVDLDQPIGRLSRIDAIQQQKMAAAARKRNETRLRMTEAALANAREGDYGLCRNCEEDIEFARLQARPETPFCLTCQQEMELRLR